MLRYRNLDQTALEQLAAQLAQSLQNHGVVIGLIGPLGAGKTTFIKSFAQALEVKHTSSPTFVVTHEHPIPQGRLYHIDFYRLTKLKQLEPLGLTEMMTGQNIVLIEWVDRFPALKKQCDILITLKPKPDHKRNVTIATTNHK